MERLSNNAIDIINDLHTERLDYLSEYIPLIDAVNSLAGYEDTGLTPQDIEQMKARMPLHQWAGESPDKMSIFNAPVKKIIELVNLDKKDRLAILPCKIGDTVYQPSYKFTKCTAYDYAPKYAHDIECEGCDTECDSVCNPYIHVGEVTEIRITKSGITVGIRFTEKFDTSYYTVGKSVFLTREEAESVLNKK